MSRPINTDVLVTGLMIMAFGVLLLLDRLEVIGGFDFGGFWPLILIGFGLAHLLRARARGSFEGGWLLLIGLWFLGMEIGLWRMRDSWPVMVVAVGIVIVWGALRRPGTQPERSGPEDSRG